MASPQKEKGYAPIANEILEALSRARLSGEELRIVLHIIRKTYGYHRKDATMSYSEIANATNIKRNRVVRLIKRLYPNRVIAVSQLGDRKKQVYEFNKNYDEWTLREAKKPCTPIGVKSVPQLRSKRGSLPFIKDKKKLLFKMQKICEIPNNIFLTDDMKEYAQKKGIDSDLNDLFEGFTIYHRKKGTKFKDWHAAWQTWVRNHIEFQKKQQEPNGPRGRILSAR